MAKLSCNNTFLLGGSEAAQLRHCWISMEDSSHLGALTNEPSRGFGAGQLHVISSEHEKVEIIRAGHSSVIGCISHLFYFINLLL